MAKAEQGLRLFFAHHNVFVQGHRYVKTLSIAVGAEALNLLTQRLHTLKRLFCPVETKPFNQKVLEALFNCALAYSGLLPFDYKITSNERKERQECFIRFHEENFFASNTRQDRIVRYGFLQESHLKRTAPKRF